MNDKTVLVIITCRRRWFIQCQQSVIAQKSTAPSKPMTPAAPNAVDTLRRPASLLLFDEPLAVLAGELEEEVPLGVDPPEPEEPVEVGLEPEPLSVTVELTQEVETPAWTVTMSE